MWLRTLLIALLIFFVVRFVMRLMRGVVEGMSSDGATARRSSTRSAVKMVADPICGTYVIPGKALQATRGRETHYFCSDACRAKWESS
jgi:YHS domain-containing protein